MRGFFDGLLGFDAAILAVVFEVLACSGEVVGVSGSIAIRQGELVKFTVGPVGHVGVVQEELGFEVDVIPFGALGEPVGAHSGADEFGFVSGGWVFGVDGVGLEPAGFEGFEVFDGFVGQDELRGGASSVLDGVHGGNRFAFGRNGAGALGHGFDPFLFEFAGLALGGAADGAGVHKGRVRIQDGGWDGSD